MKRSGRINPQSARRRSEAAARARVRIEVLARADGRCEYADVIDWLPCGILPGHAPLEVDELRGGSYRCTEYLDVDSCRAVCSVHHRYKTEHKNEVLALLAIYEADHPITPRRTDGTDDD